MNYEALGRYTEACGQAETDSMNLHNALAELARQISASINIQPSLFVANEIDFQALRKVLEDAQTHYSHILEAVQRANHEAPLCERSTIGLFKLMR